MLKLVSKVAAAAIVVGLSMPVFADDLSAQSQAAAQAPAAAEQHGSFEVAKNDEAKAPKAKKSHKKGKAKAKKHVASADDQGVAHAEKTAQADAHDVAQPVAQ
jgi:predicted lipid-binding transport protein (Tim44 family)